MEAKENPMLEKVKAKAKRRAIRAWDAIANGQDWKEAVRHKLLICTERTVLFDWKGDCNVHEVRVWKDKNGRVYARALV